MRSFEIGINDAGQRADRFLTKACPSLPKSLLYKAFRKRDVKRNGKRIPPEEFLSAGDVLQVYLPDDCFADAPEKTVRAALPAPEYFYEDGQIAILKKPVNLPVHADNDGTADNLAARFLADLSRRGEYDAAAEQSFSPALCNRLDRNTEGFVIGAKTAAALRFMNEQIRRGAVRKQYLCIVAGKPPKPRDSVTAFHRRLPGKKAEISETAREGFREIRTDYEMLAAHGGLALLLVTLGTGRTHQIRAQMAALGCPLLGDSKYGSREVNRRFRESHQLLAACLLSFDFSETDPRFQHLCGRRFFYVPDFCRKYAEFAEYAESLEGRDTNA